MKVVLLRWARAQAARRHGPDDIEIGCGATPLRLAGGHAEAFHARRLGF
ncbi:MAG TPA: hypothetical protein VFM13_03315 [Gaiellaceae bacterium]|nr:hypothetical protein [Gaiellaceae bacterium]